MSWISTFSGKKFDPLNPSPDEICIEDIAHALSNLCRFSGHCTKFYSVAQHSVLVAETIKKLGGTTLCQLQGLLHDGSEAYVVDMPRPIKLTPQMREYRYIEAAVGQVIFSLFDLGEESSLVKKADDMLLATEARDLMGNPIWSSLEGIEVLPNKIVPKTPYKARVDFMRCFQRLMVELGRAPAKGHVYYECEDRCDYGCNYCDGGLSMCTVCGGAEGSLTKECPGRFMSEEEDQGVYKKGWDYLDGKWVKS